MKREIKFRGKKIDNNEWVYGGYFSSSEEEGLVHYIFCSTNSAEPIILETIGQFTGLKDKNGIEIYEGDIVELFGWGSQNTSEGKSVIIWDIDINGWDFERSNYTEDRYDFIKAIDNCKITGNIYENPKLL